MPSTLNPRFFEKTAKHKYIGSSKRIPSREQRGVPRGVCGKVLLLRPRAHAKLTG